MNTPLEADAVITSVAQMINSTGWELESIPSLVVRIIEENMWPERMVRITGEIVRFRTFAEFVTTSPPAGLGTRIETLLKVCKDTQAFNAIDEVTQREGGRPVEFKSNSETVNNVNSSQPDRPVGNASQYALRKLRKDRPDLHKRVLDGELSPHAAMVEAGFRPPTATVVKEPDAVVNFIMRHFSDEERAYIVRALLGLDAADGD
jgi:hypothetical protein